MTSARAVYKTTRKINSQVIDGGNLIEEIIETTLGCDHGLSIAPLGHLHTIIMDKTKIPSFFCCISSSSFYRNHFQSFCSLTKKYNRKMFFFLYYKCSMVGALLNHFSKQKLSKKFLARSQCPSILLYTCIHIYIYIYIH